LPVTPTINPYLQVASLYLARITAKTIVRGAQTSPFFLGFSTFRFVVLQAPIRYHESYPSSQTSARRLRLRLPGMSVVWHDLQLGAACDLLHLLLFPPPSRRLIEQCRRQPQGEGVSTSSSDHSSSPFSDKSHESKVIKYQNNQ